MFDILIGLEILWKGMLSMFVTMTLIMCVTIILTKATSKKKDDGAAGNDAPK